MPCCSSRQRHAGAAAAAITCGPDSFADADVYVVAKALAEATAIAISEVYVSYEADDGADMHAQTPAPSSRTLSTPSLKCALHASCQTCTLDTFLVSLVGLRDWF